MFPTLHIKILIIFIICGWHITNGALINSPQKFQDTQNQNNSHKGKLAENQNPKANISNVFVTHSQSPNNSDKTSEFVQDPIHKDKNLTKSWKNYTDELNSLVEFSSVTPLATFHNLNSTTQQTPQAVSNSIVIAIPNILPVMESFISPDDTSHAMMDYSLTPPDIHLLPVHQELTSSLSVTNPNISFIGYSAELNVTNSVNISKNESDEKLLIEKPLTLQITEGSESTKNKHMARRYVMSGETTSKLSKSKDPHFSPLEYNTVVYSVPDMRNEKDAIPNGELISHKGNYDHFIMSSHIKDHLRHHKRKHSKLSKKKNFLTQHALSNFTNKSSNNNNKNPNTTLLFEEIKQLTLALRTRLRDHKSETRKAFEVTKPAGITVDFIEKLYRQLTTHSFAHQNGSYQYNSSKSDIKPYYYGGWHNLFNVSQGQPDAIEKNEIGAIFQRESLIDPIHTGRHNEYESSKVHYLQNHEDEHNMQHENIGYANKIIDGKHSIFTQSQALDELLLSGAESHLIPLWAYLKNLDALYGGTVSGIDMVVPIINKVERDYSKDFVRISKRPSQAPQLPAFQQLSSSLNESINYDILNTSTSKNQTTTKQNVSTTVNGSSITTQIEEIISGSNGTRNNLLIKTSALSNLVANDTGKSKNFEVISSPPLLPTPKSISIKSLERIIEQKMIKSLSIKQQPLPSSMANDKTIDIVSNHTRNNQSKDETTQIKHEKLDKGSLGENLRKNVSILTQAPVETSNKKLSNPPQVIINDDNPTQSILMQSSSTTKKPLNVCLSKPCVEIAANMLAAMNGTIDPCTDFYQYACGRWDKENIIPEGELKITPFTQLTHRLHIKVKGILEEPFDEKVDRPSIIKAKKFYQSCMNEKNIEKIKIKPLIEFLNQHGGWPILANSNRNFENHVTAWNSSAFDPIQTIARLRKHRLNILIHESVNPDKRNSSHYIIGLDQPKFPYQRDLRAMDKKFLNHYYGFMLEIVDYFGVERHINEAAMKDVLALEYQLVNISFPLRARQSVAKYYLKMTVEELQNKIPKIDWMKYLSELVPSIKANDSIAVLSFTYFQKLAHILETTPKEVLANYIMWKTVHTLLPYTNRDLIDIEKTFNKLNKFGSVRARWYVCVYNTMKYFPLINGHLFVQKYFADQNETRQSIHNISNEIIQIFNERLPHIDWMDKQTRVSAQRKADFIIKKIGFPDLLYNLDYIDELNSKIQIDEEYYFENIIGLESRMSQLDHAYYRKPVDRTEWKDTILEVNAYYHWNKNYIMIPAGILQPPFYENGYPRSIKYSRIGFIIGHETTHAFDISGSQYNEYGNQKEWWSKTITEDFKKKAECIIQQYGNYIIPDLNIKLSGFNTQSENIADNGGIKQAYAAFKKSEQIYGEDYTLPSLTLNPDQIFFLSFAQIWCGLTHPDKVKNDIPLLSHPYERFRVIGTLSNFPSFAKAYNCPLGSPMNPIEKCAVW